MLTKQNLLIFNFNLICLFRGLLKNSTCCSNSMNLHLVIKWFIYLKQKTTLVSVGNLQCWIAGFSSCLFCYCRIEGSVLLLCAFHHPFSSILHGTILVFQYQLVSSNASALNSYAGALDGPTGIVDFGRTASSASLSHFYFMIILKFVFECLLCFAVHRPASCQLS